VGSVRGEIPDEPWWTYTGTKLETADTAKGSLQLTGSPLLGNLRYGLFSSVNQGCLLIGLHVDRFKLALRNCLPA